MLCAISLDPHMCVCMGGAAGAARGHLDKGRLELRAAADSVATGEARLSFQQQHARVHTSPGEEGQLAGRHTSNDISDRGGVGKGVEDELLRYLWLGDLLHSHDSDTAGGRGARLWGSSCVGQAGWDEAARLTGFVS